MGAYAQSKLLSLMWTLALARRVAGTGVTANATNPGAAWTPGTAGLTPAEVPRWRFIFPIVTWFRRRASAEKAARSTIQLAADPAAGRLNGAYVESDGRLTGPAPAARRLIDQERAWALAERLAARVPG
jgi:NAD(P)-dependent dehydrogenase (short-subunit alcohol dehydrogenase family)